MNFTTICRTENAIKWIDQTKLPLEIVYIESADYLRLIEAIKRLEVRGAPAIGIAAAYALAAAINQHQNIDQAFVYKTADEIKASRPTAVNLFWAIDRMISKFNEISSTDIDQVIKSLWSEAEAIHSEDKFLCEQIGIHGSELIKKGDSILTHCNAGALATGGIGTALGVIYTCHNQNKKNHIYADETRPLLQGARLTAWELQQENIKVTLICDNTAGMLMKQGKIDHVIVGADRVAANGDFANKIGTYSVAVLAKENKVPFYIAAPYSTFDNKIKTGDDIVIEERSSIEVTYGFGMQTAPDNIEVYSPAFDVTPQELVSFYITDKGLTRGGR